MMHLWRLVGLVLWGLGFWPMAQAQSSRQETDRVQAQVQEFLAQQADLQGRTLRLEWSNRRVKLPACTQNLSFRLADRQKPVGWVGVVARCQAAPGTWERVLQVRVHWSQKYLTAARNLMPGERLSADDLVWAEADSARLGDWHRALEQLQRERHQRWIKNWSERLACCLNCDEEYTDAQVIVVNEEKSCPHCKEPEHKYYYYCEEHGSSDDDCKR